MKQHLLCACCLAAVVLGVYQDAAAETSAFLPLGRSWVSDKETLPRPCGIGIDYYYQRMAYDVSRLSFNPTTPAQLPFVAAMGDITPGNVRSRVNEVNAKLDIWILPFLNLFGIIGYVEENTKVNVPQLGGDVEVDDNGYIGGGGATFAYGIKHVWATVTIAGTYAGMSNEDAWIRAFVLSPRIGYKFNTPWSGTGANIWIGTMYQNTNEEHKGRINLQGIGPMSYDVKLEGKEPWNLLAGVNADLWGRVGVEIEAGGIMDRQQVLTALTYRF